MDNKKLIGYLLIATIVYDGAQIKHQDPHVHEDANITLTPPTSGSGYFQ